MVIGTGGYLISLIPKVGVVGFLILFVVYFMPTLVAFDLLSSYQKEYKIEKLLHPKRFFILILNVAFGLTVIGWLALLAFAFKPGSNGRCWGLRCG